jgi:hypothetical protein
MIPWNASGDDFHAFYIYQSHIVLFGGFVCLYKCIGCWPSLLTIKIFFLSSTFSRNPKEINHSCIIRISR